VLQEPEQGVAEDAVVFVVGVSAGNYKANIEVVSGERCLEVLPLCHFRSAAVPLAHGAGDPGEVHILTDGAKGGDHATAAPAPL